jgi:general secretion pathway protein C
MARIVRRYFWLVGVATVVICSVFAANAASHVVESRYWVEPSSGAHIEVARVATVAPPADKDGAAIAERNMFCSDCGEVEPGPGPDDRPDLVPLTSLPIKLVATNLAELQGHSFATIRDTSSSGQQGAFWVGDSVPGGGPIEKIGGTQVIFVNSATNRRERLSLFATEKGGSEKQDHKRERDRGQKRPYEDEIKKVGENSFEIDRALVMRLMKNPPRNAGARVRPMEVNGEVKGFKVSAIRRNSLVAALGVENGDVIQAVNGMELTTPDRMLEIYSKLRDLDSFSLSIMRGGKPVTMSYAIR